MRYVAASLGDEVLRILYLSLISLLLSSQIWMRHIPFCPVQPIDYHVDALQHLGLQNRFVVSEAHLTEQHQCVNSRPDQI